jgi:hypothetical protein
MPSRAGRYRATEKSCGHCGRLFGRDVRSTWAYWSKQKYCSQACAGRAWSTEREARRPDERSKFEQYVLKGAGCWLWTGTKDKDGYGLFSYSKKMHRAHVKALEFDGRPVPAGMYGCHHCDNPSCVNPGHLYPGTPSQNARDAVDRGRAHRKTKLSAEQVRAIRSAEGTHEAIAKCFGVSRANVSLIREGKTWRNV